MKNDNKSRPDRNLSDDRSTPHLPETLRAESDLVRAVLQADEEPTSPVSRAASESFGEIHSQLMSVIEQDVQHRANSKNSSRTPFKAWLSAQMDLLTSLQRGMRPHLAQLGVAAFLLVGVGMGGHQLGRSQGAQALPIQNFVDDFDEGLRSEMPLDFVSLDESDASSAARWLSTRTGQKVKLPTPAKSGARILGARQKAIWSHPVAQAHYIKNGVRVALYQVHEPRCGVSGLEETSVGGHTFMTAKRGAYHVVVWRKGDDIVTMVSSLAPHQALRLAAAMRDDDSLT